SHNQRNGTRVIHFTGADGKRRTLRLGKVPKESAEETRRHVHYLLAAATTDSPLHQSTVHWLAKIGDELHGRLAAVKLTAPRQVTAASPALATFLQSFLDKRAGAKPNSLQNY